MPGGILDVEIVTDAVFLQVLLVSCRFVLPTAPYPLFLLARTPYSPYADRRQSYPSAQLIMHHAMTKSGV
jgi:hypothetical protein